MTYRFDGVNIFILVLVICSSCATSHNNSPIPKNDSGWIPFEWEGMNSGNKHLEKGAMLVPFSIKGIPHQFKSQLDLGSPWTMVYGNSIKPYLAHYKNSLNPADTAGSDIFFNSVKKAFFPNAKVNLGNYSSMISKLGLHDNYGYELSADSVNTSSIKHIGTVGADIFIGKVLLIDYPNQRIKILDSLSGKDGIAFDFVKAKLEGGRIKIPLMINGEEYWFMFDTGASLFPISASAKFYDQFAQKPFSDSIHTNSWGKQYWVYGSPLRVEAKIGTTLLPSKNIYRFPNYTDFFKGEKITGLVGNAYFFETTIAIDFKNKRFGISKR